MPAPISITNTPNTTVINPSNKKKDKQNKYSDPLDNWVLRALSCTNELGVSVKEIAPKLSTALWVPTFMYLGADIYDKYKNDKNHYSPSGKRGVEHAIAQGISSFLLPAAAILAGQKLASPFGELFKDGITINSKDAVIRHTRDVIDQCIGEHFEQKEKFKDILTNSLENKIAAKVNDKSTSNIFVKIHRFMRGDYSITTADKDNLFKYAANNTEILFEIKEKLINNKRHPELSKRIFKRYLKTKPLMQKLYGKDYADMALKRALKDYQNSLIVKNKLFKTLGGLISLMLLIKPIDVFVNKTLLPKYIAPGINVVSEKLKESNHMRLHVKSFDEYHSMEKNAISREKMPKVYLRFLGLQ